MKRKSSFVVLLVLAFAVGLFQAVFAPARAAAASTIYDLGISTPGSVGVLVAVGSAWVDVEISSGAAGDFFMVWDSSQPALANSSESGSLVTQNHKRIATVMVTATNTGYRTIKALPVTNGVVILKSADGRRVTANVQQ
jgi:hypothetical protein